MYLRFNVESQHLTRTDRSIVVARSENYLKAKFDFSPDWDGVTKTAVFTNGGRVYNVILDNDECFVPTEVIRKGCFTVSVFGGDLITADVISIRVEPSGYEIGGSPEPPTPEVYEQILGMFDKFRGGEEGQVLSKSSDEDLEFEWVEQTGGGGGGTTPRWGNIEGTLSNQTDLAEALAKKQNAADAFDGNYQNLTNKPELFSGDYNDLTNKPALFSGNYNDLTNKPTIPAAVVANPALAGTEPDLSGLQIGDAKFKVPSGGSAVDTVVDFGIVRTFCVVGDSYASGQIYKADLSNETVYALSWGQVLARMCGNTCINASFGGAMCSTWLSNSERGLTYLKSQAAQDLYLIQMGINDSRILGTEGLGDITDISSHEDYHDYGNTFYGNYGKIVAQIKEYAPNARIILMTFAYQWNATETAYNNAIKAIANYFEIPCIDVNTDSFYADNGWWDNERIANHPVALGYSAMARVNKKLIEQNMKNNASYWNTYGFASTPTPVQKELSSISVSVDPSSYSVGDTLGTVTVTAHYSDNTTADVTSSATIDTSSVNMSTAGTYPVSASYTEDGVTKTASVNIVVGSVAIPTTIVDAVYDGSIESANSHCDDVTTTVGSHISTYAYALMDSDANGKTLMYNLTYDNGIDESNGVGLSFEMVSSPASSPSGDSHKTLRPATLIADGQWHEIITKAGLAMLGETGLNVRTGLWSTAGATASFPVTIDNVHIKIGYV